LSFTDGALRAFGVHGRRVAPADAGDAITPGETRQTASVPRPDPGTAGDALLVVLRVDAVDAWAGDTVYGMLGADDAPGMSLDAPTNITSVPTAAKRPSLAARHVTPPPTRRPPGRR
jgi:hypothetical protein